jgi:type II secretory pathway pseudopilin PulG
MLTVFVLGIIGTIFSATLPTAVKSSGQAQHYKIATAIAQRKMEQLRAMDYESLNAVHLTAAGVVDPDCASSPYTFTQIDNLAASLPGGTGTVTVEDVEADVKQVQVSITWTGVSSTRSRSINLTALFADRRVRRVL